MQGGFQLRKIFKLGLALLDLTKSMVCVGLTHTHTHTKLAGFKPRCTKASVSDC